MTVLHFSHRGPEELGGWRTEPVAEEPSCWTLQAPSGARLYYGAVGGQASYFLTLGSLREARLRRETYHAAAYKRDCDGKRRAQGEIARLQALLSEEAQP